MDPNGEKGFPLFEREMVLSISHACEPTGTESNWTKGVSNNLNVSNCFPVVEERKKRTKRKKGLRSLRSLSVPSLRSVSYTLLSVAYFIFMRFARPLGKYPIVHKSSYTQIYSLCVTHFVRSLTFTSFTPTRNSFQSLLKQGSLLSVAS